MSDVLPILQLKQRMAVAVGQQQKLLTEANAHTHQPNQDTIQRDLLRDLADRLEKLLVIDRENETLLRRLLGGNDSPAIDRLHQASSSRAQTASPSPSRKVRIRPFQPRKFATPQNHKP